jgi:hypothetical protein
MANGATLARKRTMTHHYQRREQIKRLDAGKEALGEIACFCDVSRWTIARPTWGGL